MCFGNIFTIGHITEGIGTIIIGDCLLDDLVWLCSRVESDCDTWHGLIILSGSSFNLVSLDHDGFRVTGILGVPFDLTFEWLLLKHISRLGLGMDWVFLNGYFIKNELSFLIGLGLTHQFPIRFQLDGDSFRSFVWVSREDSGLDTEPSEFEGKSVITILLRISKIYVILRWGEHSSWWTFHLQLELLQILSRQEAVLIIWTLSDLFLNTCHGVEYQIDIWKFNGWTSIFRTPIKDTNVSTPLLSIFSMIKTYFIMFFGISIYPVQNDDPPSSASISGDTRHIRRKYT